MLDLILPFYKPLPLSSQQEKVYLARLDFVLPKQDCNLKANDRVLQINGETIEGKTYNDIVMMVKDIEEHEGSIELLITRKSPTRHLRKRKTVLSDENTSGRRHSWHSLTSSSQASVQVNNYDNSQ